MFRKTGLLIAFAIIFTAAGCQLTNDSNTGSASSATLSDDVASLVASGYNSESTTAPESTMELRDISIIALGGMLQGESNHHCEIGPKPEQPATDPNAPAPDGDRPAPSASYTYALYDIDGNEQTAYDALTTEKITWTADMSGDMTFENIARSFARHSELVVSGLNGENTTFTINGLGSNKESSSITDPDTAAVKTFAIDSSYTLTDIVCPVPAKPTADVPAVKASPYPLSGTIAYNMTVDKSDGTAEGTTQTTIVAVITFDGTSNAQLVVNGTAYVIDLSKGHAKRR